MSRQMSYSRVLSTFVAEAAHDTRASVRAARARPKAGAPSARALHRVRLTHPAAAEKKTLGPTA